MVGLVTLLAVPSAWILVRSRVPLRRLFTVLHVLPLAVPGYVMATAALDVGGYKGFLHRAFGIEGVPLLGGYDGALLVLALYTYPYMFLTLRAAMAGLDPAREEAARSLGATSFGAFRHAVLPQLVAAWSAGALLVGLHAIGDFGVASLMRYDTLGVAVEQNFDSAFGIGPGRYAYPAGLGLFLLVVSVLFVAGDLWLLRKQHAVRAATRPRRRPARRSLGAWSVPAYALLVLVPLVGVGAPLVLIIDWLDDPATGVHGPAKVLAAVWDAVRVSLPAALLGVLLVLPVVLRATRTRALGPRLLERATFLGYATPRIVLGLAIYVLALQLPDSVLAHPRKTVVLLILAYAIHFMAEAVGPLRATLLQVPPRMEEAARTLGLGRFEVLRRVTLPLVGRGVAVATAFLFLACMKDLPLTLMLRPHGFDTPALRVYDHASEVQFASAAPYAVALVLTSAVFVALLVRGEDRA